MDDLCQDLFFPRGHLTTCCPCYGTIYPPNAWFQTVPPETSAQWALPVGVGKGSTLVICDIVLTEVESRYNL